MKRLIEEGVVKAGSIDYWSSGSIHFLMHGIGARNIVLQADLGIVRMVLLKEQGRSFGLLRHKNRKYFVELQMDAEDNLPAFPANSSFHVLPLMKWEGLSEEEKNAVNDPVEVTVVAGSHYRDAVTTNKRLSSAMAVEMPRGDVFIRVVEPGFMAFGISWMDESTGLVWSQSLPKKMHWNAAKVCEQHGGRLPSIQELEQLSERLGFAKNGNQKGELNHLFPRHTEGYGTSPVRCVKVRQ